jgi:hypothetical protein
MEEKKNPQRDEAEVKRQREQQHTGNHDPPEQAKGGADRFGGTRAGAENVERK